MSWYAIYNTVAKWLMTKEVQTMPENHNACSISGERFFKIVDVDGDIDRNDDDDVAAAGEPDKAEIHLHNHSP